MRWLSVAWLACVGMGCGADHRLLPDAPPDAPPDANPGEDPPDAPPGVLTADPPDPASAPCAGKIGFPDLAAVGIASRSDFAVADVDGDGRADIVYAVGTVFAVGLGRGDGTFAPPLLTTITQHFPIELGDVDGDGDLDLVVLATNGVRVAPNLGGGRFGAVQTIALPFAPVRVALGDLDGDGRSDIAVLDTSTGDIVPVRSTATGFVPGPALHFMDPSARVSALAIGDVTGDGRADLVVATTEGTGPSAVVVQSFTPAGTPAAQTSTAIPRVAYAIALVDLDEDGRLDVAMSTTMPTIGAAAIAVLLGQPGGTLGAPASTQVGMGADSPSSWITAADVDGDGHQDIGLSNGLASVSLLHGTGTGGFAPRQRLTLDGQFGRIAFADLDGDGHPEAIIGASSIIATRKSSGTAGAFALPPVVDLPGLPFLERSALLDLDDDHVLDLVGLGDGAAVSRRGLGDGTFGAASPPVTVVSPVSRVARSDLDDDGRPDLVVASPSAVKVLMNHGTGALTPILATSFPANLVDLGVGDVDGDGYRDVVVGHDNHQGSAAVDLLHGHGNGRLGDPVTLWSGAHLEGLALGDFDRDGKLDLVLETIYSPVSRSFLAGHGDGTFAAPVVTPTTAFASSLAARDVNGDGILDLVAKTSGGLVINLGAGNGTFGPNITSPGPVDFSTDALSFADVDGDGHLDVFHHVQPTFPPYASPAVVYLGTGTGSFTAALFDAEASADIALGDLDRDGRLDMLGGATTSLSPPAPLVSILRGTCR